jgi:DNA-binding NarL/FixJ family response regulator
MEKEITQPVLPQVKITKIEMDIALLCANGFTSKRIGKELYRSHRTIENTKRRIQIKLNARNDSQMISELFRRKIIS